MKTFKLLPLIAVAWVVGTVPHPTPAREDAAVRIHPRADARTASLRAARPQPLASPDDCGIKPPIELAAEAEWTAALGSGRLPVTVAATLETEVHRLQVRLVGTGVFSTVDSASDLGGPWSAGREADFRTSAPVRGSGEGSLQITFEALDGAGRTAFTRRTDLFIQVEGGQVWGSYSSPTDLRLWRAAELADAGLLDEEALEADREATVQASVVTDSVPRDSDLSESEWRLQRAFEAVAPPAEPAGPKGGVSKAAVPLTVKGKVLWTDSAGKTHGLPMARVEIRDDEAVGSDLITAVTTDAGGNYTSSFSFDDGLLQGNPDIFVRVLARSAVADLKPDGAGGSTYAMNSPVQNEVPSGSNLTINLTAGRTADNETVFGVHHALVSIGTYAGGLAGTMPSQVDVRFPTTRSTSLFDSGAKQLHILRLDRFDWDVIHHEYGHYFQNIHGFQNNPGGRHSFNTNLSSTRGSKSVGVRLSWGEGWPTFFGTSGQAVTGAKALAIPNVGDVSYQDTEDATTSLNLETSNGVGEDDEVSVMATLWDLYDSAADGVDETSFSDKFLFNTFKSAAAKTAGDAWEAVAATQGTPQKADVGGVFGQSKIAPELLTPADNFSAGASPPAFTWRKNGGGAPNPLNDFRIRFYKSDFSSIVFEKDLGNVATFTPSAAEWTTILGGGELVKWVIEGKNTSAPATPGGTLDRYWSRARTLGGVSIVFVIDDTGSMSEEIAGVRNALQAYITEVRARLRPGQKAPTIQLLTFKDNVTTRITSNDLTAVSAAVGALSASGGNDCPEASAQALKVGVDNIAAGGTILLATDASSQPGVDIGAVIARARAKGVTVNTILSGDCEGISSRIVLASGADCGCEDGSGTPAALTDDLLPPAAQPADDSALPPPVVFRSAPAGSVADGFIQKPGASDPPQEPIVDPGQPPIDEAGNSPAEATQLIVGENALRGIVGLDGDPEDYFAVRLESGVQYAVQFQIEAGSFVSFALLDKDGTSVLRSQGSGSTTLSQFLFTPSSTGDYFIRASASAASFYLLGVREDAFAGLTSAVAMFSTVSAQTGGAFFVRDDVNSGNQAAYEAALLNIMLTTLGPTTLLANPSQLQQGTRIAVELTGNGTNWRSGTSVAFPEGGISVVSLNVLSATRLRVTVQVDAAAPLGFQDVQVTTPLGSTSEVATGRDLVQIVVANSNPAILSVEPATVSQGNTATVLVRGINTAWDSTSVLTLGTGITVDRLNVRSATLIEADVTVDPTTPIGFRTATVTTTGGTTTSKTRAVFVNSGIATLPEIVRISPALGTLGSRLNVRVTGINTHFRVGVTTASFGDGVRVLSTDVIDETTVVVRVAINAGADLGFRNVTVDTGGEVAVLLDGFFVDDFSDVVIPLPRSGKARGCLDPDAQVTYLLTGAMGDRIDVRLRARGGKDYAPSLHLIDPSGKTVVRKKSSQNLFLTSIKLPLDGEYRLVVGSSDNAGGCFNLRVEDSSSRTFPLPRNGNLRGNLKAGASKIYAFSAGAGDKLVVSLAEPPGGRFIGPRVTVVDSTGAVVARRTLGGKHDELSLRLPGDGRFQIIVTNGTGKSGRFALEAEKTKRRLPPWLQFAPQARSVGP